MAVYILIRKIRENAEFAEYAFGVSEDKLGILQIQKDSGKIFIIYN